MNSTLPPLEILLTVDVEFSIHGAFTLPDATPLGEENVLCPDASGREQGLGRLLDILAEHRLIATFFCETLQTTWFGPEPMGRIVQKIHTAGHDAQLHLHPCWAFFHHPDWRERLRHERPNDNCHGRTIQELTRWIRAGREQFRQWGVPQPVALRAGGLRVDRQLYRVMADLSMPLASHVGIGIFMPEEPELRQANGLHRIDGVLEVPVMSYHARLPRPTRPWRALTLTGTSWWEMRALLDQARRTPHAPVVVLIHPRDLAGPYPDHTANRLHQSRLERLCRLIATHPDHYQAVPLGTGLERWLSASPIPSRTLSPPWWTQLMRILEMRPR
ncbi:MAG: polysaccharide deacetylase [Magnetococcales bacterium]|nr:polysaccharide deacetylase [Magnetococcales bacterium]